MDSKPVQRGAIPRSPAMIYEMKWKRKEGGYGEGYCVFKGDELWDGPFDTKEEAELLLTQRALECLGVVPEE